MSACEIEDAIVGSQQLEARLNKFFWRWEVRHGFRRGSGKILVPAGYQP